MTDAVCFSCGEIKHGAFLECQACSKVPLSEADLVLSLLMTDWYFDRDALEELGNAVSEGNPPQVDQESYDSMVKQIHKSGMIKVQKEQNER